MKSYERLITSANVKDKSILKIDEGTPRQSIITNDNKSMLNCIEYFIFQTWRNELTSF